MRDKLKQFIKDKFSESKYKIMENNGEDHLKLKIDEKEFTIEFDGDDLESEVNSIIESKDYYIKGNEFFNFILIDTKGNFNTDNEENHEISINVEDSVIEEIKLTKEKSDSVIFLNNFQDLVDESKVNFQENNVLSEIIKDEIVICEVRYKNPDKIKIENIINSILMHISFSRGILLDNPSNMLSINNISRQETEDICVILKDNEPMLYFLIAEKSDFAHYKYLEYYHVLEYYFLEYKVKVMDDMIKEVTSERFLGMNLDESYYHKLNQIYDHFYNKEKRKNSSELEELQYVISKDLGYKKIKHILEHFFNNEVKFLTEKVLSEPETKVEVNSVLCIKGNYNGGLKDESVLDNSDIDHFCNSLAKRIYKIRNSIVHTKKYESDEVFTPTNSNISPLINDLKFIRLISYFLMKNKQIR